MSSCCSKSAHKFSEETVANTKTSSAVVESLHRENARFLAFIERRVGSRALAEEILQDAYVRGLTHGDSLREDESVTAWFYRILRNAIVDRHRRRGVEERGLQVVANESETTTPAIDEELMSAVCACVGKLVDSLKPEYQEAIRRVDLEGASVSAFAEASEVTPTNARVRVHRAREALRKKVSEFCGSCASEGCRDCGCGS